MRAASLSDSRWSRISAGKASSYRSGLCLSRFRALSGRRGGGLGKLDALAATAAFATRTFVVSSADPNFLRTSPPLSRQSRRGLCRRGAPFAQRDVLPTAQPSTPGEPETGRRALINRIAPPRVSPHHFPSFLRPTRYSWYSVAGATELGIGQPAGVSVNHCIHRCKEPNQSGKAGFIFPWAQNSSSSRLNYKIFYSHN